MLAVTVLAITILAITISYLEPSAMPMQILFRAVGDADADLI